MTRDDYRPSPAMPRHGVRAALRAWATAAALVGIAYALAAAAAGDAPPPDRPFSSATRDNEGRIRCHLTAMETGAWTAGHCHARPPAYAGVWPYSTDPVRDLGHVLSADLASPQPVREAVVGEAVEWRNVRGVGSGYVAGVWYSRGQTNADAEVKPLNPGGPGWYPVVAICYRDGHAVIRGDSGSGVWAEDGALVGIVARASLDRRQASFGPCGGRQWIVAVQVP